MIISKDCVSIIKHNKFIDSRGSFEKIDITNFNSLKICFENYFFSTNNIKGTIRGMHFKHSPCKEWKLVTCVGGKIFDVVVDIRKTSKNYGKWNSFELSDESGESLLIPPGFAHGYQTLTNNCNIFYHVSNCNKKAQDGRLKWNDPIIQIKWPLKVKSISYLDENAQNWPIEY